MSESFKSGDRVAGYTLLFRLGKGGMGEVWAARRGQNATPIAMKLLRARTDKRSPMFLDEARTAAALRHPHIVSTFESGVERGLMYIAMELVPGPSLHSLAKAMKRSAQTMPPRVVRDIGIAMADALAYASEVTVNGRRLDLVHRDISPHNILVSTNGRCFLSDFGVARTTYQLHETIRGEIRGKPGYMSPEQVNEEQLDPRSDLFCLAIVLWELATQQRLFKRATLLKALVAVAEDPAPDVRELQPTMPAAFAAAIARCLNKDPAERFQSAAELRVALEALDQLGPRSQEELAQLVAAAYPTGTFDVAAKTAQFFGRGSSPARAQTPVASAMDDSFASVPTLSRPEQRAASAPDLVAPRRRPLWPLLAAVLLGALTTWALRGIEPFFDAPLPSLAPLSGAPAPSQTEPPAVEDDEGASPRAPATAEDGAVLSAARKGDLEALQRALKAGGRVDARDDSGWSGLHFAVQEDRLEILDALLEAGADPNLRTEDRGDAPLHLAARLGRHRLLTRLVAAQADANLRNFSLDAPAHSAVFDPGVDASETLRTLSRAGADLDAAGALGHTPLMRAAVQGHESGLRTLLRLGQRPNPPVDAIIEAAAIHPPVLSMLLKVIPRRAISAALVAKLESDGHEAAVSLIRRR